MRRVKFNMSWVMYGSQEIDLPDFVPNDDNAIEDYIREHWADVSIPSDGQPVGDSDMLDSDAGFEVSGFVDGPTLYRESFDALPYAIDRRVRVDWENLDEGVCGDFNPEDPEDVNLLRFTAYLWDEDVKDWRQVEDASYCTNMPADADPVILNKSIMYLLKRYSDVLNSDPEQSVKKMGEELSWIGPEDFEEDSKWAFS